jgi:pimeloyl-ACP methyl ester carboxylesterase
MKQVILFILSLITSLTGFAQANHTPKPVESSGIYALKKGSGRASVVFVSGLGEDHTTWKSVQDSIARVATTLSYDRSGLGKSPYAGQNKGLASLAEELQSVIISNGISGRVILVGHSLGCQVIKKYASLYPGKVQGIIFLDPGFDERKLRSRLPDSTWIQRTATLKKYMPVLDAARQAEFDQLNSNCEAADEITVLPRVPIFLFTATSTNPNFPGSDTEFKVKLETHQLWLRSMPAATHIKVEESRHYVHNDRPDLVIKSIVEIISQTW